MTSIDYIFQHFLTLDQVAEQSGVPLEKLTALQKANCLPGPAYRLKGSVTVSSLFGEHEEMIPQDYYPHSHVIKARELAEAGDDLAVIASQQEEAFKTSYKDVLLRMHAKDYGLAHLFTENGDVAGKAADQLLDSEWQHYLDGTYGLCTKSAMAEDIAAKEIMITKIKWLIDRLESDEADQEALLPQLKRSVDLLDHISMPFAPHERERSSRGKYIDSVRAKYCI